MSDLEHSIRTMTACIGHRGPDADGHVVFPEVGLALGHRRLAIVDLSPTGAQPMYSSSGRYCVVFNGEIYNFLDLRAELLGHGHVFRGTSDTEVMLAAFETFGMIESLRRFAGMFAFCVWDADDRCLWLARDRMGEKPLYYGAFGETFAFASELKSLRSLENCPRAVNPVAVSDVLERGFIRGERTIYSGISKLLPGTCARVAREGGAITAHHHSYWSVANVLAQPATTIASSDESAIDALDALLGKVVGQELIADVPVGAFLSGGIDSSLIVAIMQRVSPKPARTFTIGFDDRSFDESGFARAVAAHLGTTHTEIRLKAADALAYVERLPTIFDEPFADSSQLPTLLVCQATREHVTVALSGDGGDELFGGYSQYQSRDSIGIAVSKIPTALRRVLAPAVDLLPTEAWSFMSRGGTWPPNAKARVQRSFEDTSIRTSYESLLSSWVDPSIVLAPHRVLSGGAARRLSVNWPDAATAPEAQMAYDMQTYLPDDILVKVDRSSMSASLETRAPLLDHRVVEFALQQPLHRKLRNGEGKYLLRQLLRRYLPPELWSRPKQGFAIPLASWLRGTLRPWVEAQLDPDPLLADWFDARSVEWLWHEHLAGTDHAARLWRILMVLQWLRVHR